MTFERSEPLKIQPSLEEPRGEPVSAGDIRDARKFLHAISTIDDDFQVNVSDEQLVAAEKPTLEDVAKVLAKHARNVVELKEDDPRRQHSLQMLTGAFSIAHEKGGDKAVRMLCDALKEPLKDTKLFFEPTRSGDFVLLNEKVGRVNSLTRAIIPIITEEKLEKLRKNLEKILPKDEIWV